MSKHILVTNDDGVLAPGLLALAQEMRKLGKVNILAPDRNYRNIVHRSEESDLLFRFTSRNVVNVDTFFIPSSRSALCNSYRLNIVNFYLVLKCQGINNLEYIRQFFLERIQVSSPAKLINLLNQLPSKQ